MGLAIDHCIVRGLGKEVEELKGKFHKVVASPSVL